MNRHARGTWIVAAMALAGVAGLAPAQAQDYPARAIEFVIPFGAGDGADIEGRVFAAEMEKALGVSVTPINKPGGGGAITYAYIKNADPDGYKVAWSSSSILTTTNLGNTDFFYDAMDHVGQVQYQPQPFVVRAEERWPSFEDFVADCKASPGAYTVANSGTGSATHVAAIALMDAAGCEVVHLPKDAAERNKALLNGEAYAMVAPLGGALKLTEAGKFRMLTIPSAKRNALIPDVPTAVEFGYDAEFDLFRSLTVPKGTPEPVIARLAEAMVTAANSDAFRELAAKQGFTVETLGPAEFAGRLAAEDSRVKAIFQRAGMIATN